MSWIACACFTRPRFEPPNEPDSHDPSGRRLLGQSIACGQPVVVNFCTGGREVVALDVFKDSAMTSSRKDNINDSAMTSSRKDNKFFACLCFSVQSCTEVSPLVCAHLTRQDSSLASPMPLGQTASKSKKTLPSLIEMSVALNRHPLSSDLRNGVDP